MSSENHADMGEVRGGDVIGGKGIDEEVRERAMRNRGEAAAI